MQITEIHVSAGRTFNDPDESYANFKPSLTLKAQIEPGEDADAVVKSLQARAESMMEEHKEHLLKSVRELREVREFQRELTTLESTIRRSQERLTEIRTRRPELAPAAAEQSL